jgi:uncharacterized protein YecA (UPF0149 family)
MQAIGRNDRCPCGSGKKYKNCCGAIQTSSPDLIYNKIRRLDGEAVELLLKYAKSRYGEDCVDRAFDQYGSYDEAIYDVDSPEGIAFFRWFPFQWRPLEKESIAELFLLNKKATLSGDLVKFIEATITAPYSFLQIIEVDFGKNITVRDIFRKCEFHIIEKTGSTTMQRGQFIFGRIVEMDGVHFMMGNGPMLFPPMFLDHVLQMRSFIEKYSPLHDKAVTTEILMDFEDTLRDFYFDLEEEAKNFKLNIRNRDGDPLVLHTLTYKISSAESAFHALKELELKVTGRTDDDLLHDAERSETGKLTKVILNWLKKTKDVALDGSTLLATLTITASELLVEVNSDKRSRRVRREIHKRLGEEAVLMKTESQTLDSVLQEASLKDPKRDAQEDDFHENLLKNSPEARQMLKEVSEKHWERWPDMPLPGLRGKTPREAMKDPLCRELLESMLMDFELRNGTLHDEFQRIDVEKLRRKLELPTTGEKGTNADNFNYSTQSNIIPGEFGKKKCK